MILLCLRLFQVLFGILMQLRPVVYLYLNLTNRKAPSDFICLDISTYHIYNSYFQFSGKACNNETVEYAFFYHYNDTLFSYSYVYLGEKG